MIKLRSICEYCKGECRCVSQETTAKWANVDFYASQNVMNWFRPCLVFMDCQENLILVHIDSEYSLIHQIQI
jgi:hypothetical protein